MTDNETLTVKLIALILTKHDQKLILFALGKGQPWQPSLSKFFNLAS